MTMTSLESRKTTRLMRCHCCRQMCAGTVSATRCEFVMLLMYNASDVEMRCAPETAI